MNCAAPRRAETLHRRRARATRYGSPRRGAGESESVPRLQGGVRSGAGDEDEQRGPRTNGRTPRTEAERPAVRAQQHEVRDCLPLSPLHSTTAPSLCVHGRRRCSPSLSRGRVWCDTGCSGHSRARRSLVAVCRPSLVVQSRQRCCRLSRPPAGLASHGCAIPGPASRVQSLSAVPTARSASSSAAATARTVCLCATSCPICNRSLSQHILQRLRTHLPATAAATA